MGLWSAGKGLALYLGKAIRGPKIWGPVLKADQNASEKNTRRYVGLWSAVKSLALLQGIPEAPTFYPTEEEFANPLTYIDKIRAEGER